MIRARCDAMHPTVRLVGFVAGVGSTIGTRRRCGSYFLPSFVSLFHAGVALCFVVWPRLAVCCVVLCCIMLYCVPCRTNSKPTKTAPIVCLFVLMNRSIHQRIESNQLIDCCTVPPVVLAVRPECHRRPNRIESITTAYPPHRTALHATRY